MSVRYFSALGAAIILGAGALAVQAEQSSYAFQDFNGIKLSDGIELTVISGAERYLVEAEAGGLSGTSRLQIDQTGQMLEIDRKERWSPVGGLLDGQIRVTVHLPELSSLSVQAGSMARVSGAVAPEVEFDVTSGSALDADGIRAEAISLQVNSGGDLEISGVCARLDVKASSGANIDAEDLRCKVVEASASSGADLDLTATEELRAKASSGADISVEGNPGVTDVKHSFGGAVRIRG